MQIGEEKYAWNNFSFLLFPFSFLIRISGKPPLAHALFLLKEFFDTPKWGESEYAYDAAYQGVFDKQCTYGTADADEEENPPRAGAEVVFRFDHNGVEQADAEEGGNANKESFVIHESCILTEEHKNKLQNLCPFVLMSKKSVLGLY